MHHPDGHCQAHWSEFLSSFNYMVSYCPGRLGGKPDLLTCQLDIYPKGGGRCLHPCQPTKPSVHLQRWSAAWIPVCYLCVRARDLPCRHLCPNMGFHTGYWLSMVRYPLHSPFQHWCQNSSPILLLLGCYWNWDSYCSTCVSMSQMLRIFVSESFKLSMIIQQQGC